MKLLRIPRRVSPLTKDTSKESSMGEHLLPGEENMLIKGVSSEGLLRWAI